MQQFTSRCMPQIEADHLIRDGFIRAGSMHAGLNHDGLNHDVLTVPAKVAPAAAARAGFATLKAVLAVHGAIASGLEWNGCLLSASGTDHTCTL